MKKNIALTACLLIAPVILYAATPSAEEQIREGIRASQPSVVHLWAAWCSNCQAELKSGGWTKIIRENPQTHFFFVSVWDSGNDGRVLLAKFEIANQPNVTVLADPGPRGSDHIKQFAGMPLSWIPTTWIYKDGDLRYAFNYGEMRFPVLEQCLKDSVSDW